MKLIVGYSFISTSLRQSPRRRTVQPIKRACKTLPTWVQNTLAARLESYTIMTRSSFSRPSSAECYEWQQQQPMMLIMFDSHMMGNHARPARENNNIKQRTDKGGKERFTRTCHHFVPFIYFLLFFSTLAYQ